MGRLESVFVFYGCTGGGERLRGREEPPLVLLGERGLGRGYSFSFGGGGFSPRPCLTRSTFGAIPGSARCCRPPPSATWPKPLSKPLPSARTRSLCQTTSRCSVSSFSYSRPPFAPDWSDSWD